jgi:hypothetical protein
MTAAAGPFLSTAADEAAPLPAERPAVIAAGSTFHRNPPAAKPEEE